MSKEDRLKHLVTIVGKKYVQAPMPLKITIGEILEGKVKLNCKRNKKSDRL